MPYPLASINPQSPSGLLGRGASFSLPYTFDPSALGDGALPAPWVGATFAVSSGVAVNTPVTFSGDYIDNGTFALDANWSKAASWSIAGGKATHAAGSAGLLNQANAEQLLGKYIRLGFDVLGRTAGGVRPELGGSGAGNYAVADGSYINTGRVIGVSPTELYFNAQAAFDGSIDNVVAQVMVPPELFATLDAKQSVVTIQASINSYNLGTQAGIIMNLDSVSNPLNFVIGYLFRGFAFLDKCVNGVYTILALGSATYASGKILKIVRTGTTYRLSYDGVQMGTDQTISDAGITDNTICGLFSTSPLNSFGGADVTP